MPTPPTPPADGRSSGPRPTPFERGRWLEALRAQRRVLLAVTLLGLFGGALAARLSVPLDHEARAVARLLAPGQLNAERVLDDHVLSRARELAQEADSLPELRARVQVAISAGEHVVVTAHAPKAAQAERLADSIVGAFVTRQNAAAQAQWQAASSSARVRLEQARLALEGASSAYARALAAEAGSDPAFALERVRAQLPALDAELAALRLQLAEARARRAAVEAQAAAEPEANASTRAADLLAAQRTLSLLLAEHADDHPDVAAQRLRIRRLQSAQSAPSAARPNRAETRALGKRIEALEADQRALDDKQRALAQRAAKLQPLREAQEQARAHVRELEKARATTHAPAAAEVTTRGHVVSVTGRTLRLAAALLTPMLSLLLLVTLLLVREARGFRVCAATELAHWLSAPVVAVSAWPEQDAALESLVDTLFDGAVDASGITLLLPLSEVERPLAHTLAAQLNRRAQRHFRSATGARVTLAQAWEGDLSGTRVRRGAEAADRVLWIVTADQHKGAEVAQRRAQIARADGVAGLLLEARSDRLASAVGDAQSFWAARADTFTPVPEPSSTRVAVH